MDQAQPVDQIGPEEAARLLAAGAGLIDVREIEEWQVGPGAPEAIHIPLGELGARLDELPSGPHARHGLPVRQPFGRGCSGSGRIGLPAVNLAGGMQAWQAAAVARRRRRRSCPATSPDQGA